MTTVEPLASSDPTATSGPSVTGAQPAPVTVLGLGAMGSALARAFLAGGHPTTVWNRTPGRAEPLAAAGAVVAPTLRAAVTASPLVVACVLDYATVHGLLEPLAGDLRGRDVVNLTSGPPERARQLAAWAGAAGAGYLDGAIMVTTAMIGTDDALVLYSGAREVFDAHRASLSSLGGEIDYLGTDPGLAAVHDLGMLDIFFAGMTSFLHAAALVGADGVTAASFVPYAQRIGSLLQTTFGELAADVDAGHYPGEQDNLEMELAAVDHISEASRARGITVAVPELVSTLVREAIARGHGRDGFSRVVEVLRGRL